jgi:exonuclease VII small subunit
MAKLRKFLKKRLFESSDIIMNGYFLRFIFLYCFILDSLPSPRQRKKMFSESEAKRPSDFGKRPLQPCYSSNGQQQLAHHRQQTSVTSLTSDNSSVSSRPVHRLLAAIANNNNDRCDSALSSFSVQSEHVGGVRQRRSKSTGSGFLSDSGLRRHPIDNKSVDDESSRRRSGIDAILAHQARKHFDFEQALKELESIYKSLNLDDDELLDRAESQEAACLYEKHMKKKRLDNVDGGVNPLAFLRRKTIASFPDKLNDDMAVRRAQLSQKFPEGKQASLFQERSGSYLLLSPALSPAISVEYFGPAAVTAATPVPGKQLLVISFLFRNHTTSRRRKIVKDLLSSSDNLYFDPSCILNAAISTPGVFKTGPNTVNELGTFKKSCQPVI